MTLLETRLSSLEHVLLLHGTEKTQSKVTYWYLCALSITVQVLVSRMKIITILKKEKHAHVQIRAVHTQHLMAKVRKMCAGFFSSLTVIASQDHIYLG